jgi:stage II sporulation protein D
MKGLALLIAFILFITIVIPITLIKGCDIASNDGDGERIEKVEEDMMIEVYNTKLKKVQRIELEEYIKGVVAAEMPAEFHIEALKAQAVAARTYAIYHLNKYRGGHPDHPQASLCTGIHCQAWMSNEELIQAHGQNWMTEYWPKIEQAVESTKGEVIFYAGEPIEPLFHSTSGGFTEDSEEVFSSEVPYLRSVKSPYEDGAPRLRGTVKMTVDEFIKKLESRYPNIKLTKESLPNKVKLVERTESGRIKAIKIDTEIVTGREMRELFNLNSTNFKITVRGDELEIETVGYGHGVGMSQWGANGMAEHGSDYKEILTHYYTGVEIKRID